MYTHNLRECMLSILSTVGRGHKIGRPKSLGGACGSLTLQAGLERMSLQESNVSRMLWLSIDNI